MVNLQMTVPVKQWARLLDGRIVMSLASVSDIVAREKARHPIGEVLITRGKSRKHL